MNQIELYEFDRQGFIHIPQFLTTAEIHSLSCTIEQLETHARSKLDKPKRKISKWGPKYYLCPDHGYHFQGGIESGETLIIEDFFNFSPAFDFLVSHEKSMEYISAIVQEEIGINNSELRIRYPGNFSSTHMGGPLSHKYRYTFNSKGIDCMMVRIIYFIHSVKSEEGAFCVVPGTHKSNFNSPYKCSVNDEPGMIGLEVDAGDAILFTENLRHGGFTNRSQKTRKTLHVGYGPSWMMSQNIATMDEPPYITEETWGRYEAKQQKLFRPWLQKHKSY